MRRGGSLIEILAALGILGIVGGLVGETMSRHQRLFRLTSEAIEMRRSVRDAVEVLAEDLRSSARKDTIPMFADSAVEFFSTLGTSVVCSQPGASDVGLAPMMTTGIGLTSWIAQPDTGDLLLLYRSGANGSASWERYRIRAVTTRPTSIVCPAATGLGSWPGASSSSYVITLLPWPPVVRAGSPLRFIRRGRYSLYRSADAKWYLGYRRCNAIGASVCGLIQPLSGYYNPYSADSAKTGILFRYFDSSGSRLSAGADPLRVARIEITVRAVSGTGVTIDGRQRNAGDSSVVSAAIRDLP